uniref:Uncharacterized protein n=1 Tax=Anguilla anguilla TaxID=7936 RepID=A0A0E9U3J7_ANGAN
MLSRIVSVQ